MTVVVSGFKETARAFSKVNRQFARDIGKRLRQAAKPVADDSTVLAGSSIRNLGAGDPWAQFRVGGGVNVVYVAPKQRGHRTRSVRQARRPNLADLLMGEMTQALEQNRSQIIEKVDGLLEEMEDDWGRGG